MKKLFGFYVLGYKGYSSLRKFIEVFGSDQISFVISDRDNNIKQDFYDSIELLCKKNGIVFNNRKNALESEVYLKFAIGWRWIIKNEENLIVFHDSLLPEYRGFAPLVNALINGEKKIGVTALKAQSEYDAGDIVDQRSISVRYPKKISEAIQEVAELYGELLIEICNNVLDGNGLNFVAQDASLATYSPWRNADDYKINWSRSAEYIARFIDAVGDPYNGAETSMNGSVVWILDSQVVSDVEVEDRLSHVGKVIFMNDGMPTVICGRGLLRLKRIVGEQGAGLEGKIPFRTKFGA